MVVILIFAIIVLLAVAVVSIISKYFKLSVYMKGLFFFGILVSMIFILFFLSSVSTYFSFDLVHGGDKLYSRSITKSESIKRGVYLRDLKLDPSPFHLNDTMSIKIKEAWIEKDWTQGYWFWTTQQGVNGEYNITIIIDEVKGN